MKRSIFLLLVVTLTILPIKTGAAQTRDPWHSVRTNHLFVIGNADPEKLRQVAVWLEFFHTAFGRLVSRNVLDPSVPTTVIVFRDDTSFVPFKPLYQGRPANLAGFFQPGYDVNYIAMSLDQRQRDPFSVAFHEYVHLHMEDNVPLAPVWLNEGLAEFYGHLQFSGSEALLGAPLPYLNLLRNQELLPLSTLLSIDHNSPHYNEQDKSGIFYGESWALVHYLMLGGPGRQDQFRRFLQLVSRGDDAAKSLEDAFGMTLDTMDKELRAYINRGDLPTLRISASDPQSYAYTAIQRESLTEAEANYYLGDLLLHINRSEEAERYFKQAIAVDSNMTLAYATLGQLCIWQKRFVEAKKYLERGVISSQNYLVHYQYGWLLAWEAIKATQRIESPELAAVIREHLSEAMKLRLDFAPSYYVFALVNYVRDERLDEAFEMAQKARRLDGANAKYTLLLAEIYARRSEVATARELVDPLTRSSDANVREEAQNVLDYINKTPSSNRGASASARTTMSGAMVDEPRQPGTTRIMGGEFGGTTAIRDGSTIEQSGTLPSVDEVIARYVEASGGDKAITAVTSRVMKGTVDIAGMSRGGTYESYQQAPNKLYVLMDASPIGLTKTGYNGHVAWSWSKEGTKLLNTAAEIGQYDRDADLYLPVGLKKKYAKVTLAGTSQIGYREVYVLDLQPPVGTPERLYLDVKTYLPVRMNRMHKLGNISVPVEIYLDDWRTVDGVKLPFSLSETLGKLSFSFTITEIKHNIPVDPKLFEPPKK